MWLQKILKQVSEVSYLNICFEIQPDGISHNDAGRFTVAVRNELLKNAHAMVNYAEIDGRECMRLIIANYDLKKEHLDQLFLNIESAANKLLSSFTKSNAGKLALSVT